MKKLLLSLAIAATLVSCGPTPQEIQMQSQNCVPCEESQDKSTISNLGAFPYGNTDVMHIEVIDSCEYIVCNDHQMAGITMTHKGNCVFCKERNTITPTVDSTSIQLLSAIKSLQKQVEMLHKKVNYLAFELNTKKQTDTTKIR